MLAVKGGELWRLGAIGTGEGTKPRRVTPTGARSTNGGDGGNTGFKREKYYLRSFILFFERK